MAKKDKILTAENGFAVMMTSGAVITVRANKYLIVGSEEISFLTNDDTVVGRFRYSDVSGIVNIDHT